MPKQKDLKRRVRARMQKTGESYTTARSHLLSKRERETLPADLAAVAKVSERAVQNASGMSWREWVDALDAVGAAKLSHREIAAHVGKEYPVSSWWAQSITVGYERIRGLRDFGQRRGGGYDVNKSKTVAVPIGRLYRAFSEARTRRRWLADVEPEVRTRRVEKSIRWTWDDGSRVHCYFIAKGEAKSTVQIQHGGHEDREAADARRRFWTERLNELADMLTG